MMVRQLVYTVSAITFSGLGGGEACQNQAEQLTVERKLSHTVGFYTPDVSSIESVPRETGSGNR